jgi:beta-phosphoglucomutase-like phosphatase (HAD superfamily)
MRYKAVLFDMDGLFLDTERQYLATFLKSCETFGLPNMEHVFYECIGLRLADSTEVLEKGLGDLVDLTKVNAEWDARINQKRSEDIR